MTLKIIVFCLAAIYCLFFFVRNVRVLMDKSRAKKDLCGRYFEMVACICIFGIASLWCFGAGPKQIWIVAAIALAVFTLYLFASILTNLYKSIKSFCNGTAKVAIGTIVIDTILKLLGIAVFAKLLYDVVAQID